MTSHVDDGFILVRGCAESLRRLSDGLVRTAEVLRGQASDPPRLGDHTRAAYRHRCAGLAVRALRIAVRTDHLSQGLHCLADELAEAARLRGRGLTTRDPELLARADRLEQAAQQTWLDCLGRLATDAEADEDAPGSHPVW